MKRLLLWLIIFYKRFLSPHKGFSCAYRVCKGKESCSSFACRAIKRSGAFPGLILIRRRLRKCSQVARERAFYSLERQLPFRRPAFKSGHCDIPIPDSCSQVNCDSGVAHPCGDACNTISTFGDPCSGCDIILKLFEKREDRNHKTNRHETG